MDYVNLMPSKAQSLVIGISGGIDSSVSSTLSAMTGLKTIVLSMPIKQNKSQHDLSLKHQEWLVKNFKNVEAHTINLDKLFSSFKSTLSNFDNEDTLAWELKGDKLTFYENGEVDDVVFLTIINKNKFIIKDEQTDEGGLAFNRKINNPVPALPE